VNADLPGFRQRLERIRGRMAEAARRAGRDPAAVRLVGASKTVPAETVVAALRAGLEDIGENRVQEAEEKIERIVQLMDGVLGAAEPGSQAPAPDRAPRFHLIGPLQSNKAARAARLFQWVHSVDRADIAHALARHAGAAGRRLNVLIEVNVSGEEAKFGVAPDGAAALAAEVATLRELDLQGLMTLGPRPGPGVDPRPAFARLRELRDGAERATGLRLPQLSMGMSGDFEAAIEEGSTMVRIGTALFGAR
jgi:pyridoxal phosphate enzyme (YggS family)